MSDLIESLKRTPMPFRQKVTFALLSLVILCSGFGLGVSLTFNHLKDRLRPRGPVPFGASGQGIRPDARAKRAGQANP
jgi:hypothetical protein